MVCLVHLRTFIDRIASTIGMNMEVWKALSTVMHYTRHGYESRPMKDMVVL